MTTAYYTIQCDKVAAALPPCSKEYYFYFLPNNLFFVNYILYSIKMSCSSGSLGHTCVCNKKGCQNYFWPNMLSGLIVLFPHIRIHFVSWEGSLQWCF